MITVFGGTGFLGRHVVTALRARDVPVRIATRNSRPSRAGGIESDCADIRDAGAVARALEGSVGAVNAVSAYVEKGGISYQVIHVDAARELGRACARASIDNLIQLSGIGANPASDSRYIRARGQGERAVLQALPTASIIRPAIMFGHDDTLIGPLVGLIRRTPVVPLVGGSTRMQPVWVEDVAAAIAASATNEAAKGTTFELGGPDRQCLRHIVDNLISVMNLRRTILPVPFTLARFGAHISEMLPRPPLTMAQIELLNIDTIVSNELPGFESFDITPRPLPDFMSEHVADL